MAHRRRHPGKKEINCQPGIDFNYMYPIPGPNYPVAPHSNYYPQQQFAPPNSWSNPGQHFPGQPPNYFPPGQYMTDQQQYPSQYSNHQPGQNMSRRRQPESPSYYAQARPQPVAYPPEPPYQFNPEIYQAPSKKASKKTAEHNTAYSQQGKLASEPHVQPLSPRSSLSKPTAGSSNPNYKNWQDYKGKK